MPLDTEEQKRKRIYDAMAASIRVPRSTQAQTTAEGVYPNGVRRQPWDERLPSGESAMDIGLPRNVRDMLTRATIQGGAQQRDRAGESGMLEPPRDIAPKINIPPASMTLPSPNPSMPNVPPPMAENGSVPTGTPKVRIGYSTEGLTGVGALMQRRKAMEEADPTSKVTRDGEILPPEQSPSRLRGAGNLALLGAGTSDPDHPMRGLGALIGGGITGALNPRGAAEATRKFEMAQLDNDVARGLKLEQEQTQTSGLKALTRQRELEPEIQAAKLEQAREIQNAKLEIERQKAAGLITKAEADRQQRELDRKSREQIAADRIQSNEKIAGMRPNGDETHARKGEAAQAEYDQLVSDEQKAGEEKNRAYDYLASLKANPSIPKEDVAEATRAAEEANKIYQSFAEKKRDAQTRIKENTVSQSATYSGRTMSRANLERYAKDKGLTVDAAKAQVESQGVRVQ